jgi:hypothetical protein
LPDVRHWRTIQPDADQRINSSRASRKDAFLDVDCGQLGILDLQRIVNVCFRQSLLKYSDYSGKLTFFDKNDCVDAIKAVLLPAKRRAKGQELWLKWLR